MSRFYIGQKIVAIKDHSQGRFKKGDEFTVLNIRKRCCFFEINIGIKALRGNDRCATCDLRTKNKDGVHWFNEGRFSPIQLSETTFEDVIAILNKDLILN